MCKHAANIHFIVYVCGALAHLLPEELSAIQKWPTIASAGGGHHLYSLRRTGELGSRGHDVVLVNSSRDLLQSGRATGVISHTYAPKEDRIDVS
jgi:hypothetical protein